MTSRRREKVGAIAVAVVITLVLGACTGDNAGASQGTTKLANSTTGPTETGPSSPAPGATTLTLIDHPTKDGVIRTGGKSQGDILWFYHPVYDETDTTKVGRGQGFCIRINPKTGTWQCSGTTFLEDGQLMVEGRGRGEKDTTLAVTGGTGLYSGASGTLDVHFYEADDGFERFEYVFTLT